MLCPEEQKTWESKRSAQLFAEQRHGAAGNSVCSSVAPAAPRSSCPALDFRSHYAVAVRHGKRDKRRHVMPIYLDRHDTQGVTAEAVATLHQEDLKIHAKHACRVLTYWFDEQRGTGFCLIEAPSTTAVRAMHREAHGLVPNVIVEVEPSTVLSFLGRITDPHDAAGAPIREAGFRAIMFTDMANSTQITQALGDAGALAVLTKHHQVIREVW